MTTISLAVAEAILKPLRHEAAENRRKIRDSAITAPDVARKLLDQAKSALHGYHLLPGSAKPFFCGNPPEWFTVFGNDNESLWILNRHWHWRTLLIGWVLDGSPAFAARVLDEAENWLSQCIPPRNAALSEYRYGVSPWRSLEVGIRMFEAWDSLFLLLPGSEFESAEFFVRLLESMRTHGNILHQICPIFWPDADHNHYVMENLGLLSICQFAPQLDDNGVWRKHALTELERCAQAQITSDGGHIEGCPGYHNGVMEWFCKTIYICRKLRIEVPGTLLDRTEKMLDYSLYAIRPGGGIVPWGDSDVVMDINLKSIVFCILCLNKKHYLHYLSFMVGEKLIAGILAELSFRPDTPDFAGDISPQTPELPLFNYQKELNQAMVRSDWGPKGGNLFFACRTPVQNAHAHQDPGGFDYSAFGRPLLVDPGRFCYREDEDRRRFKSAFMHNTVTLDGREPFVYIDSWTYGAQHRGELTGGGEMNDGIRFSCMHENYSPAILHRTVHFDRREQILLLLDRVKSPGEGNHQMQLNFNFQGTDVTIADNEFLLNADDISLRMCCSRRGRLSCRAGRYSTRLDQSAPSTLLQWNFDVDSTDFRVLTVIIPASGKLKNSRKVRIRECSGGFCVDVDERTFEICD